MAFLQFSDIGVDKNEIDSPTETLKERECNKCVSNNVVTNTLVTLRKSLYLCADK